MSLTHGCDKSARVFGVLLACGALASGALAEPPATNSPTARAWTVHRPAGSQPLPLARLVHNPEESEGAPKYALADQSGTIRRFVEPVPGIDLEPYVGYAVKVRHDTGRTLLATQLELPGQERESILDDERAQLTASAGGTNSLVRSLIQAQDSMAGVSDESLWNNSSSPVQPAQYVDGSGAPIVIQEGMPPMQQGMPGMQQGMPVMQQGMPPMMGPQGMVTYNPTDPTMMGAQMGGFPPGAGPVYLDGPMPCGPQGCPCPQPCPQPQMFMQPMPCPQPVVVCPPPPPPLKWSIWGEGLWLHPTGVDMAHAQQQDGIGGAGTVPFGQIGVVDPEYDLGLRAGAEVRFGPKEAIFGQFARYESSTDGSLAAPSIPGGGGAVGSLVHHPGAALTASAGPVTASYDIDFQLGDLAYRYFVHCTNTGEVSVFVGGRYGKLDQRFAQDGIFGGGLSGNIDTTTDIDFMGAGPIVGIVAERLIDQSRFSVYGKSSIAALAGSFDSTYLMFNDTTDQTLARATWSDDRIVPMLDYELGIMWTGPQNHFRVALGYMASYWFNAVTTPVWVDAVQADNYVNIDDTIAFDGAVGRVELRW